MAGAGAALLDRGIAVYLTGRTDKRARDKAALEDLAGRLDTVQAELTAVTRELVRLETIRGELVEFRQLVAAMLLGHEEHG